MPEAGANGRRQRGLGRQSDRHIVETSVPRRLAYTLNQLERDVSIVVVNGEMREITELQPTPNRWQCGHPCPSRRCIDQPSRHRQPAAVAAYHDLTAAPLIPQRCAACHAPTTFDDTKSGCREARHR